MRLNTKLFGTKPLEEEPPLLTKELHALVQQELPQKLPDPGRFLIPCTIGTMAFKKALCDLGSSINLMPLSIMEKLGILEVQAAHISLEMADKTMKRPYGLVEDVLVKVESHYIPANFIVLDIGEDEDDCVILGRPFLATSNAIIDVAKGELTLKLGEDHILFKMPQPNSPEREITVQHLVCQPSLSVQSSADPPDINSKFGVGQPSTSSKHKGTKKKVPKGWKDKKVPTEGLSPGMRVVFTKKPALPHTVSCVLSLEHVELIHERTGRKFTVRGKNLSPYSPP